MMTFAVFGAGFLMRPIGAVVLGAYIDKVGRRKGLIVTLSIMAAGTFLIVLIPSYHSIGLWAPLLVLIGRLLQGFSAGAELAASRYIWRKSPPRAVKASTPAGSPAASRSPLWWRRPSALP
ncbi:Proline porter II [Serratia rubidaea]|uniref:Proline porter II n=1 Tax=Serratia rubidaea TaxID=61652 RepID=A0A447QJH3_SERRU|nr:Proline porter II [Serratia rubidaea]